MIYTNLRQRRYLKTVVNAKVNCTEEPKEGLSKAKHAKAAKWKSLEELKIKNTVKTDGSIKQILAKSNSNCRR